MQMVPGRQTKLGRYRGYVAARGALCGVLAAGAGGGTTTEFLPMALLLAGFTAAAVWMFRRWGKQGAAGRQGAPAHQISMPVGDARPANV